MNVGFVKESFPGERRVAVTPSVLAPLAKAGCRVVFEPGAGLAAGYPDDAYRAKGAETAPRAEVLGSCDVLLQVRGLGTNPEHGRADVDAMRSGQALIGLFDPLVSGDAVRTVADKGLTLLALELVPRITRAQSMDVLSSMATIAGYKAVLLAADRLPKMFPMMMTAAGTISPARVFVIGAGVAGLQAIASAKRLGAVVHAYDLRPAVREQVESLGGKFVEMELDAGESEDKGGYAKEMGEEFYRKQRELMARVVAENDVVITTAAIPGKKAPLLVTADMVDGMNPGSVIVDLAAETGGNCEVTKVGEVVERNGVTVLGPANLASTLPYHSSQMFAKNVSTLLLHLVDEGKLKLDKEDPIVAGALVCEGGAVVNERVREALGLGAPSGQAG